jgi:hypothetical protein
MAIRQGGSRKIRAENSVYLAESNFPNYRQSYLAAPGDWRAALTQFHLASFW